MKKKSVGIPLYWQALAAVILGVLIGKAVGPSAASLAPLGKEVVKLLKMLATPLLFAAIVDGILQAQFHGRGVARMFQISLVNALGAVTIGLLISNLIHPGRYLPLVAHAENAQKGLKSFSWSEILGSFIPDSLFGPFVRNEVPSIIILALLIGFALRKLENEETQSTSAFSNVRAFFHWALRVQVAVLEMVVRLVPFAIFCSVAAMVGEKGFQLVHGLVVYLLVCLGGMALHVLIVYHTWILAVAKIPLRKFWREAKEPALYAFGVNSSLVTLPFTLRALERLGISHSAARLSACVGTNFNNDGILLYEVVAALFLAQAYGLDLTVFQQLSIAGICVVATLGVAGIPEAGIISLTLVLSTLGLPSEDLPLLLTVDWIVARARSTTNVLGDMTVAVGIDATTTQVG